VLLLGNVPSGGRAFYVTLNAHTGAETRSGELPFEVAQVERLPICCDVNYSCEWWYKI
jgi:hypothetical protein